MEKNYAAEAEKYYQLVGEKNVEGIKKFLHSDVEFCSPLASLKGKDAFIAATSNFMNAFKTLTIRAKFGTGDQAMVVYNCDFPGISPNFPGASLLTFRDGLIAKVELFFDASRFAAMK